MKESHRVERVERELQHAIAQYLIRYKSPEIPGLISVTRVESNRELRDAKVFITVLGGQENDYSAAKLLNTRQWEIQKFIAQELKLRNTPRLKFLMDESFSEMMKVNSLLSELHNKSAISPEENPRV